MAATAKNTLAGVDQGLRTCDPSLRVGLAAFRPIGAIFIPLSRREEKTKTTREEEKTKSYVLLHGEVSA